MWIRLIAPGEFRSMFLNPNAIDDGASRGPSAQAFSRDENGPYHFSGSVRFGKAVR